MANYECKWRSNYFRVRDNDKFTEWCSHFDVEHQFNPESGLHMLMQDRYGGDGFPSFIRPDDPDSEDEDIDFIDELSTRIAEDEVCILMEAGWEKMRYISGFSIAIKGGDEPEIIQIGLRDIYERVETEWGLKATEAEY